VNADELFGGFPADPRDPRHAGLRASDTDRERVHTVLRDAYADGHLDREEHDERTTAPFASRTLGELPALVGGLTPPADVARATPTYRQPPGGLLPPTGARMTPAELRERAEVQYASQRHSALIAFLGPSLICWAIWLATSIGSGHAQWPWPLIVTAATSVRALPVLTARRDLVEHEVRRLDRKQTRAPYPDQEAPDVPDRRDQA